MTTANEEAIRLAFEMGKEEGYLEGREDGYADGYEHGQLDARDD